MNVGDVVIERVDDNEVLVIVQDKSELDDWFLSDNDSCIFCDASNDDVRYYLNKEQFANFVQELVRVKSVQENERRFPFPPVPSLRFVEEYWERKPSNAITVGAAVHKLMEESFRSQHVYKIAYKAPKSWKDKGLVERFVCANAVHDNTVGSVFTKKATVSGQIPDNSRADEFDVIEYALVEVSRTKGSEWKKNAKKKTK